LPEILIHNALPILCVDDTSVIVTDSNIVDFQFNITVVFEQLNNWFNVNLLLSKLKKKTCSINFKTENAHQIDCKLQYENKLIANLSDTKLSRIKPPYHIGL